MRKLHLAVVALLLAFSSGSIVRADGPAPTRAQANYEVKFLTGMIDHHHMAVMMGMMCEQKAVHEELKELCHSIVETQMAEIHHMQAWLEDWYGITYEPRMKRSHERMMEKMEDMSATEFEIHFMTMMIRHHAQAVREGTHCVERAFHPELIELCESIVAAQTEEITVMRQWLCEWYDRCR